MFRKKESFYGSFSGLSRRMGQEKAELNYAETSFLNYQLKKGQILGIEERLISGYRGALVKTFQEEILITDRIPNAGPLGGLEACFQASARPYALVLADYNRIASGIADFWLSQIHKRGMLCWKTTGYYDSLSWRKRRTSGCYLSH